MKKTFLTLAIVASSLAAQAKVYTYNCTTAKGTEVVIVFENASRSLMSLKIGGKDMTSQASNVSSSAGAPTFTLTGFPNPNQITNFNLSNSPSDDGSYGQHYYVGQRGSSVTTENKLVCKMTSDAAPKQDTGF